MRPQVGFRPTTPQKAAGRSTDPTAWDPRAAGITRAATAAAEPEDEPPGVRDASQEFCVTAGR